MAGIWSNLAALEGHTAFALMRMAVSRGNKVLTDYQIFDSLRDTGSGCPRVMGPCRRRRVGV